MELVFVDGRLKRGQAHQHPFASAPFEGEARAAGLVLHDRGPFPMAIAAAQASPAPQISELAATEITGDSLSVHRFEPPPLSIQAEVVAVDAATLQRLDRREKVPRLGLRHRWSRHDGRQAWIDHGQPQQVRHVPALPHGQWRPLPLFLLLLALLLQTLAPGPLQAETSLADCNLWHRSRSVSRIELGNRIGAASYLTKRQRLQQSPPEAPVALYAESDLERACDSAR